LRSGIAQFYSDGEADDVARAVRAIADGLLDCSTGHILNVDRGFHLRGL